jgi:dTDP-4-dehydrorhamnose 3,5-epimerase
VIVGLVGCGRWGRHILRDLVSLGCEVPKGVSHAVQNVSDQEGMFVNLPSQPYRHDDPDKYRLPLENDVIPYRLT